MGDTTEIGLPRAVAIAWGMHAVPTKGPSRGLSHERIVAAGVEIADAEGIAAVTMQRVATSLGFTTMSLYRYVSGKDELLELMLDAANALPEVTLDSDWRVAIRQWAYLIRDATAAHPWILDLPRTQVGLMMPNAMAVADLGLQALSGLDLPEQDRVAVILMVSQHAMYMQELALGLAQEGTVTLRPEAMEALAEVIDMERLPSLGSLLARGEYVVVGEGDERDLHVDYEFEFGLDVIIGGLEKRAAG